MGTSEAADDVIACLKYLYTTEYEHVRPLPWCEDLNLHLGEGYTNLQFKEMDGRGHFQDIGTIVSLADIYGTREGEDTQGNVRSSVRKIRVEGAPGIGKSCSCQKLAHDWSCGKLDRFKVVFFLEMRHLAGKVKYEIFEQLLPKDTKITPDQLWSYIQDNQDDVLFILDGLDELSQEAREVTDVLDLIQGKILRNCHVLVTSRPYQCVKDLEKCHQFYKIVGYSGKNSEEFIHKYFCKSPESGLELVKQLQSNSISSEIVGNPLNNVLICVVWEDNNKKLPSSKAELYRDIVHSVAKRFCTKKNIQMEGGNLPPTIEEALRGLGKLSLEGLDQEQLQFDIDEITKKYGTTADNMLNMGLLTRDYSFSRIKRTCYCAFLHRTFQEYMAARYISGLVMDWSSREQGIKYVCHLFGFPDGTVVNRKLVVSCCRFKWIEVQNWLLLILGENSRPLFQRFAEELQKAQTDEDRDLLSFLCIMWLGTSCAGGKMAEIVAPCLSQRVTNVLGYDLLDFAFAGDDCEMMETGDIIHRLGRHSTLRRKSRDDHANWFVGLAHVLAFQTKLSLSHNTSVIQHLIIDCSHILSMQEEQLGVLENLLSDYNKLRSVTLCAFNFETPLRPFIPRCGIERVVIRNECFIDHMSFISTLKQLSTASAIEHVEITYTACMAGCNLMERDVDFTEFDRQFADMIASQSRLRYLRFEVSWAQWHPKTMLFCNLTDTLHRISEHTRLEFFEFRLPGIIIHDETFDAGPMVLTITECLQKNKVLKTLRLGWGNCYGNKIYMGKAYCSDESLSGLCAAIRENRTLETLVVEGLIPHSKRKAKMISELIRNKPSNYKELSIKMSESPFVDDWESISF
ncbi:uncharacterized protein LOC118409210 [Branchiostoma floridae]|uniref:Uncharacterized protein LOC118409210 n=1 Tax=Branchiostoma floridae TaxID=7739 RepID=A0A9J7HUU2_BRAFL|nr:uncharacterized protein LOC118409210 [Branchiostoma floridae]